MQKKQGFTLIELLTVVIIIGILTSVALPQYRRAIQKAHATEAVAMLRVILDSSERLTDEFGYKRFKNFAAAEPNKATFQRLDMFDNDTIKCAFDTYTMTCDYFKYFLNGTNGSGDFISAVKRNTPYKGVELRISRAQLPTVTCGKGPAIEGTQISAADAQKACDLYSLDYTFGN